MDSGRFRFDNRLLASLLLLAILASVMTTANIAPEFKPKPSSPSPTSSNPVSVWLNGDVVGAHPGWNDSSPGPTITVFSGETVDLSLNATDGLLHNWFIDNNNNFTPDPGEVSSPDFSASTTKVLSFSFTPVIGQNIPSAGNWTYRCKYHPSPYMYGMIRVLQRPDFSLSASPTSLTITVGTSGTSAIAIHPLFSFTGMVDLSTAAINGLQATISPPSIGSGSGTATLTITALNAGNYTATVTGTSGSVTHSLNVTVESGDLTISADPTIGSAQINTPAKSTISVGAINHFAGAVSLSSNNTFCFVSPTVVMSPGISTLSCTFASSGQFVVEVTATNGPLVRSVIVTFDVAVPDYLVVTGPTLVTVLAGQTGNSTISVQSINGFTGIVNLSESTSQGLNCTLTSASITLGASGTATLSCKGNAGVYAATVTGTSGATSRSSVISYTIQDFTVTATASPTIFPVDAGATSTPTIMVVPLESFSGTISVNVAASTGLKATASPSSIAGGSGITTLTLSAAVAGNYTATVIAASGPLTHSLKLTVQVQDFTMVSNSATFDANVNQARASTIRISSNNHLARTVIMTTNNTYCNIAPVEITTPGNTTLSCNFPVEGTFHINVTATSGSISHSVTVTYIASNIQPMPGASLLGLLSITAMISAIAVAGALTYLFMRHRVAIRRRTTNLRSR